MYLTRNVTHRWHMPILEGKSQVARRISFKISNTNF